MHSFVCHWSYLFFNTMKVWKGLSSDPQNPWKAGLCNSLCNLSFPSAEEQTGRPGLTGQSVQPSQTLLSNKAICGTRFLKKKTKIKGQTYPPSPSLNLVLYQVSRTLIYPAKWESHWLAAAQMMRKSDVSGQAPGTWNSYNPDSPQEDPNNPMGWAGGCCDWGKLKINWRNSLKVLKQREDTS